MRAAVVTKSLLMVVADRWDVEAHCAARLQLKHFGKKPPANRGQTDRKARALRIVKRGLG